MGILDITVEVRKQPLPVPDEAPITWCPWCNREYLVKEEGAEEDYEQLQDFPCLARHKVCGHLVRFISWADGLRKQKCLAGLELNDVGECEQCKFWGKPVE